MTTQLSPHPYAEAWPLLGGEELAELAEDIAATGLREPIVIHGGMILDGRNRYAACQQVGVDPGSTDFEGTDDEALAFVQSVNNARRHQSKGSLAASWALSMLAASKRDGGRWAYPERRGDANTPDSEVSHGRRAELGAIADYAPELLTTIRDGETSLNAAHEEAKAVRDEHLRKAEEQRVADEAEAKAERFIRDQDTDLANDVGTTYQTWLEAEAVWRIRNAEEAKALAEKERQARKEQEDLERGHRDTVTRIAECVRFLEGGEEYAETFLNSFYPHEADYLHSKMRLTRARIDSAIEFLTTIKEGVTQ